MAEHVDMASVIPGGIFLLIGETDVHQYKLTSAVMAQLFHLNLVYYNPLFPTHPVPLMSGLSVAAPTGNLLVLTIHGIFGIYSQQET